MARIDFLVFGVGLILSAITGWLGYRLGWLGRSGWIAVTGLGALIFGAAGWPWGVLALLLVFSSTLWSRYSMVRRAWRSGSDGLASFAQPRTWNNVLAMMGWATLLACLHLFSPQRSGILVAFVGAVATITADSWATEVGLLATRPPRLITTRRRVPAGTSGAVSALGMVATVGGAWLIGFVALLLIVVQAAWLRAAWDPALRWLPLAATIGGLVGCFVDSLLGAAAQGMYYCEHCKQQSEAQVHCCGEEAQQTRGWAWLTNNGVNWLSSVVGAAVSMQVFLWVAQINTWW